jgi:hypothetical protein
MRPHIRMHGVNLSVGYGFEPEWFACGQSGLYLLSTPVEVGGRRLRWPWEGPGWFRFSAGRHGP